MSQYLAYIVLVVFAGEAFGRFTTEWKLTDDKIATIRRIGDRITRSMKADVDPCVDYYEHMCGNFSKVEFELKRSAENKKLTDNFDSIFAKSDKLKAEVKLADYLISCKERDKQDVTQFLKDFNIFGDVGGWPAIEPNWSGDKFDLSTAIAQMQSFTISVIAGISFEAADEKTRFLHISPKRIRAAKSERELKRMRDILEESGIENIDSIMQDCIIFEKEYEKAFSTSKHTVSDTDFKGLQDKVPELEWDRMIEIITGTKLKDTFKVRLDNADTLKRLVSIVNNIDPKVVANYIFYNFVDRVHHKSVANCPEKAFTFFEPVLSRHFLENYYNNDYKRYFNGMMHSLVKTLNTNSLQMFDGADTNEIMKSIHTIVEEEYLPKLTEESVEKEYEGVEIYPDKFYENSFLLRRHNMKHAYQFFFNERTDIANVIGHTIPHVMTNSLYKCHTKPTPVVLDCLSDDLVETTVGLLRHRQTYSEKFRDCIKDQVGTTNNIENSELFAIERTFIYAHSYDNWAKENMDIVEKENDIWKEYGLTSRKVLFAKNMRLLCGLEDNNDEVTRRTILSNFRNLKEFSDIYKCEIGSPMNPEQKCEIS